MQLNLQFDECSQSKLQSNCDMTLDYAQRQWSVQLGSMPADDEAARGFDSSFNHQLANLLAEPGQPIAAPLRRLMEWGFACDFSDVVVHTSATADAASRRLRATAFTLGNHICFSEGAYDPTSERGAVLLAHELAHVAQQRLGRASGHTAHPPRYLARLVEIEADLAAAVLLRGGRFNCAISDDRGLPACWDVAGHYYTPYLMFLNAGVDPEVAQRLALWCWMPDQVSEFDAFDCLVTKTRRHKNDADSPQDHSDNVEDIFAECELKANKNDGRLALEYRTHQYHRVVQRGFHVLTGGSSLPETQRRKEIIEKMNATTPLLFRGLALHALGDCFAHRQLSIGASGPIGRYFTEGSDTLYSTPFGHARDGHDVDHIFHSSRGLIYMAYVRALDELACKYNNKEPGKGIVGINDMMVALSAMIQGVSMTDDHGKRRKYFGFSYSEIKPAAITLGEAKLPISEDQCCDHIRKVASDLVKHPMDKLHPSEEPVRWSEYCKRKDYLALMMKDSGGEHDQNQILYKIQKRMIEWSKEALCTQKGK
jgi:hypothetical protein